MENEQSKGKKSWWFLGAVGLFLLTKGKTILTLLKFSKFGAPVISMLVTVGAYALVFPVYFAIGLVIMILIHEMGHVIAAKKKGLPVSAPFFIPFLGALISMKRHPRDAVTEAYIAFGGPILGTLGAVLAYVLGVAMDSDLLLVVAYVGFFLNLINLLPIHPLDGGRISTAVTRWLWLVGLIGGLAVLLYMQLVMQVTPFIFYLIWGLFAWEMYQKYVKYPNGKPESMTAELKTSMVELEQQGIPLPGVEHRRVLPYHTYSSLQGEQKIEVSWPGLGLHQPIKLPQHMQALIERVQVEQVAHGTEQFPDQLVVKLKIDFFRYEPDDYYTVPKATRWKYGAAYAGLAAYLMLMLHLVQEAGISL